jgi:hypothetical protein
MALILAGCGGAGSDNPQAQTQTVRGDGFHFEAPAEWTAARKERLAVAAEGAVDRVEVRTFRLVKPYQPRLFAAAARELDAVVDRLAKQLRGRVAGRTTVTVAGRKARSYRVDYDGKVQEITFVLDDRREYQLLCRRTADAADDACRGLVESFALRP